MEDINLQDILNRKEERYENSFLYVNIYSGFIIFSPVIAEEARELNKHHKRGIFDKRTKGWKHIKEEFNNGKWKNTRNIIFTVWL